MISPELTVFLVAMSPIVELRGAIPLGLKVLGLPWWSAYLWAVLGNLVPLSLIVFFSQPVYEKILSAWPPLKRLTDWVLEKARSKTGKMGRWGRDLTILVLTALPIPFVGGWTGALAAFVLKSPPRRALFLVILGCLISGFLVTFISLL